MGVLEMDVARLAGPSPSRGWPRSFGPQGMTTAGRLVADFIAEGDGELSVPADAVVSILPPTVDGLGDGWLHVRYHESEGFVPASFVTTAAMPKGS